MVSRTGKRIASDIDSLKAGGLTDNWFKQKDTTNEIELINQQNLSIEKYKGPGTVSDAVFDGKCSSKIDL